MKKLIAKAVDTEMLGGLPLRRPCARSASQVGLPELGLCESGDHLVVGLGGKPTP
jgi:hypothetical protein